MSVWGASEFGDPCRECGFDGRRNREELVEVVQATPDLFETALIGADGSERCPELEWSVVFYVCHVGDNLRIWAAQLAAAALGSLAPIGSYDNDLLAQARNYGAMPHIGAFWSLRDAVNGWSDAVAIAEHSNVIMEHPDRGRLSVDDIARTNSYDAADHRWDIARILATR